MRLPEHSEKVQAWIRAGAVQDYLNVSAWSQFAEHLRGSGLLHDACHAYWHLARLQIGEFAHLINLGNLLIELADFNGSLDAFDEAISRGAGREVACHLGRGLALLYLQRYDAAENSLKIAWEQEPRACDVSLAYAQCLMELERFDEIEACIAPLDEEEMSRDQREAFAWLLANCGDEWRAIRLYQDLVDDTPATIELRIQLVLVLERLNRLDEADSYLQHDFVASSEISPAKALAMGRMLRRRKNYADAERCLVAGVEVAGDGAIGALLEFERAKNADASCCFDEAISALGRAHSRAVTAYRQRFPDQTVDSALGWLSESLVSPAPSSWRSSSKLDCFKDPTFLIGFPRSGTTLLERILDSHPSLAVLDERPALEDAIACLGTGGHMQLDASLDRLAESQLKRARSAYYAVASRYVSLQHAIVDKYPLNLTRVPYIARLFPRAKYLLLLRDPHDCVLSCYMQAFGMRGGALSFATLESAAETYVKVMSYWERHKILTDAQVHVLRYEDLVRDMAAHIVPLLAFLNCEWDGAMTNFHELAKSRVTRINTPSYSQVIEPIHNQAIGRWQNYRHHFSQRTLDLLAPWRQRYGYSALALGEA
ncbi:sulfotransferase [Xanthomonas sp. NCPPB 1325]|uniref:tetratricopeptide repeat-containing sulfotransferase family protein n=1 Tax=Xanthomonas sp. NCPPB 1325 TaxID=487529 RepID=UPI003557F3E6